MPEDEKVIFNHPNNEWRALPVYLHVVPEKPLKSFLEIE